MFVFVMCVGTTVDRGFCDGQTHEYKKQTVSYKAKHVTES